MKLPAGKTLVPEAVQKIRNTVFKVGSIILSADLGLSLDETVRISQVVERAVEKELTALSLTDIPDYVAPPVDPSAPKVGRPKGTTKAK